MRIRINAIQATWEQTVLELTTCILGCGDKQCWTIANSAARELIISTAVDLNYGPPRVIFRFYWSSAVGMYRISGLSFFSRSQANLAFGLKLEEQTGFLTSKARRRGKNNKIYKKDYNDFGSHYFRRTVSELGTRQHCRDNVTMFSGKKLLIKALCQCSLWLLHWDTEAFTFFVLFLVSEAPFLCRFVAS